MYEEYDVNQPVTLTATFIRTSDGTLANPTAITLTVTEADGTTITVYAIGALTNVSAGQYTRSYTPTVVGVLKHRWQASGNGVDSDQEEYVLVGISAKASGPCDMWIGPVDVFALAPASDILAADRDYELADKAAQAASRILYVLSDRKYPGLCRDTVRPCRRSVRWAQPIGWSWHEGWGSCGCGALTGGACGCGAYPALRLGNWPLLGIERVRIDGTTLARSEYRIDDRALLIRVDGTPWPGCQDLLADPATEDATFDVVYYHGRTPPADGILAAERLAGDIYMGLTGGECALPANLVSRTRQGDQITLDSPDELAADLLGLREVDQFLKTERYGAKHRGTLVTSPDMLPRVRRVGTA